MPFTSGLEIGPYRIMEQLGQGGMAIVYKAYHASLDRYVAVKVLHTAFMEDPNFQARFQREARLVARLEHPNIVPIYDYAEYERQPYLVMKYIEGETLKARMQRGPLNASEVQSVVDSVGAGLHFAHKQKILHRDIKPSNVILANDGGIYLADFGLARIAQSGDSTLSSDMVLGTPQYISPEQAMAKKDLDEGTDIYSFGVMLYEMTVGRVPFSGDTPFSVIHDHIYTPLPLPSAVNPRTSPELERVLLKALAKERADRFSDVPAFVAAFTLAWASSAHTVAAALPAGSPPLNDSSRTQSQQSAPLTMPVAPPIPPAAETVVRAASKKTNPVWIWAGITVLLLVVGLLAGMALVRRSNRLANAAKAEATSMQATIAAQVAAQAAPTLPINTPPPAQPTRDQSKQPLPAQDPAQKPGELPKLEEAKQVVASDPNNPQAHLIYGLTLINAGQKREGYGEVVTASDLGAQDARFLVSQGAMLTLRRQWLGAAILYVRATALVRVPEEALFASVYFAFEEELAPDFLPLSVLEKTSPALALTANIRYTMTRLDDLPSAQKLIDEMRKTAPNKPITELLQAELAKKSRDNDVANKILDSLLVTPNLPEWIRLRATELRK